MLGADVVLAEAQALPMSTTHSSSLDLDTTFGLLSSSRRRYLLYHFLESEYGTVEKLAQWIAAWEQDVSPRAVSDEDRRDVAISLVHDHLPRLADHDVVDYDARNGDVVAAEHFADIQPYVERARSSEHVSEKLEQSRLLFLYSKPPEDPYIVEDAPAPSPHRSDDGQ